MTPVEPPCPKLSLVNLAADSGGIPKSMFESLSLLMFTALAGTYGNVAASIFLTSSAPVSKGELFRVESLTEGSSKPSSDETVASGSTLTVFVSVTFGWR